MATAIRPFGLRAVSVSDNCGNEIPLCGQTFSFSPNVVNTEIKCNDVLNSRTCLQGFDVTVESVGISLEAYALMVGADVVQIDNGDGTTDFSVRQNAGDCYPLFSVFGKSVGENAESDMHVRLFDVRVTSIEGSFAQDEFFVQNMTGIALDKGRGLYEFVVHEGERNINPIPMPEALMPVAHYDVASNCDDYVPTDTIGTLTDLSLNARPLLAPAGTNEPAYNSIPPSATFDGVDDYMVATLAGSPVVGKPLTFINVMRVDNTGANDNAVPISLATNTLSIEAGTGNFNWNNGAPNIFANDGQWHVHAMVDDGVTSTYYIDGEVVFTSGTSLLGSTIYTVGANAGGGLNPAIMDFGSGRIYDQALSVAEVKAITALMSSIYIF